MPGRRTFERNKCVAYVGIDPTADSLHIGHLVGVMLFKTLSNLPGLSLACWRCDWDDWRSWENRMNETY
jgi:hypothetical protein